MKTTVFTQEGRKEALKKELDRIVQIITEKYCPERIILFGSLAKDRVHEWSDIDLLIIKETDKRPIDRCVDLAGLVKPKIGIDFLVYTPDEYDTLLKEKFSFLVDIEKHGRVLYEKRDRRVA